jgi:hypothetical protein
VNSLLCFAGSNIPSARSYNLPSVSTVCCRFASEHVAAAAAAAAAGGATNAAGATSSTLPAGSDPLTQPGVLSTTAAATDARRSAVRTYVVPLLIGLATTSSSTRAKLWASNGLDIFLQLLGTEVCTAGTSCGVLRAASTSDAASWAQTYVLHVPILCPFTPIC